MNGAVRRSAPEGTLPPDKLPDDDEQPLGQFPLDSDLILPGERTR